MILTKDAFKNSRKKQYFRLNWEFWTKRISGAERLVLLAVHIGAYTKMINGQFLLQEFTVFKITAQILLILSIAVHLFVSIKPMLIWKGIVKFKERNSDILLVISAFILLFSAAVLTYFIRLDF